MEKCKQQNETEMRHLPAISIYVWLYGRQTDLSVMGVSVGVENFFGVNR